MKRFLFSLLSGDERAVDSTITCGIAALVVYFGITIYAVVRDPSIWGTPAAWLGWGVAASAIIAIVSGSRTARARWSSGAQSATVASPDAVTQIETKP